MAPNNMLTVVRLVKMHLPSRYNPFHHAFLSFANNYIVFCPLLRFITCSYQIYFEVLMMKMTLCLLTLLNIYDNRLNLTQQNSSVHGKNKTTT